MKVDKITYVLFKDSNDIVVLGKVLDVDFLYAKIHVSVISLNSKYLKSFEHLDIDFHHIKLEFFHNLEEAINEMKVNLL